MSNPIADFLDFIAGTGPLYVTGMDVVINDAMQRNYFISRMIRGDVNATKYVQGGQVIREKTFFDDGGTFQFYNTGNTFTWANPNVLDTIEVQWRFAIDYFQVAKPEIQLNEMVKYGTAEAKFHAYVNIARQKEQRMLTSCWNGKERALWA